MGCRREGECSNFTIPHGFCVAIGMALITAACVKRRICEADVYSRLVAALKARGLPFYTTFSADELFTSMMADKKRASNTVTLVLPTAVGAVERRKVMLDEAREFLEEGLELTKDAQEAIA